MPAAIDYSVGPLGMGKYCSRPPARRIVGQLGGNTVIARNPSQARTGEVYAIKTAAGHLGNGSFLHVKLPQEHERKLPQKHFCEGGLWLQCRVEHAISAKRVVKPARSVLAKIKWVFVAAMNPKNELGYV